jgi:antitoxin YefM
MLTLSAAEARAILYRLLDQVTATHEPVLITGQHNNAVLVSEEDWRGIEETLHLLGIPSMREAIVVGLNTPVEECKDHFE